MLALFAQTSSHMAQPTHDLGSTSRATPRNSRSSSSKQSKGQTSTQKLQPVQSSSITSGLGHSVRFLIRSGATPAGFSMHSTGQTYVQAPQSMQIDGSIWCSSLFSPVIASTGHTLTQAVHPMQVCSM